MVAKAINQWNIWWYRCLINVSISPTVSSKPDISYCLVTAKYKLNSIVQTVAISCEKENNPVVYTNIVVNMATVCGKSTNHLLSNMCLPCLSSICAAYPK